MIREDGVGLATDHNVDSRLRRPVENEAVIGLLAPGIGTGGIDHNDHAVWVRGEDHAAFAGAPFLTKRTAEEVAVEIAATLGAGLVDAAAGLVDAMGAPCVVGLVEFGDDRDFAAQGALAAGAAGHFG